VGLSSPLFFYLMSSEFKAETWSKLQDLIEGVVVREGYELVALELKRRGRGHLVRVLIDRPGRVSFPDGLRKKGDGPMEAGVNVDDCAVVSRALSPVLDVEDLVPTAYTLEVSSPGVNRPLVKPQHFEMAAGHQVRVKTHAPVDGTSFFIARLTSADEEGLLLDVNGDEVAIPYRLVAKANLEYQF
jgi:ribosome maturation factor RimP